MELKFTAEGTMDFTLIDQGHRGHFQEGLSRVSKYKFRNQLKAQGNRLNQKKKKNVNKLLLVPKKDIYF